MAIYRGTGGSGDSTTNATRDEVAAFTVEAEGYKDEALVSEGNASTSASNASTSETNAGTSATNAATSETNASTSATTATTEAATATTKAGEASTSATSASTDATTATTKASEASTSATSAATEATTATTQAGIATTKASEAATSASNASTSESNASTSATTATTKASEASTSATNASTSEANAAASYDSFDDRYLGAKSSAPSLDNDGETLITGTLYWNTTTDSLFIWNGSAWDAAAFSASGSVTSFNTRDGAVTLTSGDVSAVGALMDSEVTNLADVKAFSSSDYATAAQGTTADAAQIATADYDVGDNVKIKLGDSDDLQMWHTGSYSLIKDAGTGSLIIESDGTGIELKKGADHLAKFNTDSSVQLFHAGSEKLHTTSTGIDVTGSVTALDSAGNEGVRLTSNENGGEIQLLNTTSNVKVLMDFIDSDDDGDGLFRLYHLGSSGDMSVGIPQASTGSLQFQTNGSERLRIDSNGNVGIGTDSPEHILSVCKDNNAARTEIGIDNIDQRLVFGAYFASGVSQYATIQSTNNTETTAQSLVLQPDGGNVGIGTSSPAKNLEVFNGSTGATLRLSASSTAHWDIARDSTTGHLTFTDDGVGTVLTVGQDGKVGIGTSSPSEKLYVSGNIYATGNVTAYSDERIKKNINEIPNALDAVDAIRGVTYTRTDTEEDSVGVIAQEVEAMFPELITENNEGMKSVNYNGLIGVLFSAVKELSSKVRELENV